MQERTRVVDVELSSLAEDILGLDGYLRAQALIRLHGAPLGYCRLPVTNGRVTANALAAASVEQHGWEIMRHLLIDLLAGPPPARHPTPADLLDAPHHRYDGRWPSVTVAVCTRDRPVDVARCLDSLLRLDYPNVELLVVDNAPSTDATERFVVTGYPGVRYVREPRPGLDWARNRAIREARGEILAYADDDVLVDPSWLRGLAATFAQHPEVMAVSGLVVPAELETEAQALFEQNGGFGRGFRRRWFRLDQPGFSRVSALGAGSYGTGANMAFRTSVFDQIGAFDPALDVGTVTNGGGDLEMFFRVLKGGHTLVYEPNAVVFHRHRRDYPTLHKQIANNGVGFASYLHRTVRNFPDEWRNVAHLLTWWGRNWAWQRLKTTYLIPGGIPRDLVLAELVGACKGLRRYPEARRTAAQIAAEYGEPPVAAAGPAIREAGVHDVARGDPTPGPAADAAIAVRSVDLARGVTGLVDVMEYAQTRVFVTWGGHALGCFDLPNANQPIGTDRLREAIVDGLGLKVLRSRYSRRRDDLWYEALACLRHRYLPEGVHTADPSLGLPSSVSASVVVATRDRPDDLRDCLRSLTALRSARDVELIVVDNNPDSGLTAPVVAEFPSVRLVRETRGGLSYARNAGIVASRGDIVLTTDDDVIVPPDWVERIVKPFVRADVMVVTGNVLPRELETASQQAFEAYGGLGRGFEPFEADRAWFEAWRREGAPTWDLGATANAAFRATIFADPRIGLLDEALGAGTPTGCSEDTYVFYKVLKAGYTLVYEPAAHVWHRHRKDDAALGKQVYAYTKGHVAYHLTTFLEDGDLRGLLHSGSMVPRWLRWRMLPWLSGKRDLPPRLLLDELRGIAAGPLALYESRRRVARLGRGAPYISPAERTRAVAAVVPVDGPTTIAVPLEGKAKRSA